VKPLLPGLIAAAIACAGCHPKTNPNATTDAATSARAPLKDTPDGAAPPPPVEAAAPVADDALPPFASDELTTRAKHLLEAIQLDNAELAGDLVFPRDAYLSVKDAEDPGKHWDAKVLAAFKAQVHTLHKRTKGLDRAIFTGFSIGQPTTQAMPKRHDLKRMLWRSKRSRLMFSVDGKPSHIDVVEMMGWRGAWYVTRLK
jgi:hypothetical protein